MTLRDLAILAFDVQKWLLLVRNELQEAEDATEDARVIKGMGA